MCDNTANLIKARYVVTSTSSEQALNWQALQPELSITELSAEKADFGHYKNMPQKRFRYS